MPGALRCDRSVGPPNCTSRGTTGILASLSPWELSTQDSRSDVCLHRPGRLPASLTPTSRGCLDAVLRLACASGPGCLSLSRNVCGGSPITHSSGTLLGTDFIDLDGSPRCIVLWEGLLLPPRRCAWLFVAPASDSPTRLGSLAPWLHCVDPATSSGSGQQPAPDVQSPGGGSVTRSEAATPASLRGSGWRPPGLLAGRRGGHTRPLRPDLACCHHLPLP